MLFPYHQVGKKLRASIVAAIALNTLCILVPLLLSRGEIPGGLCLFTEGHCQLNGYVAFLYLVLPPLPLSLLFFLLLGFAENWWFNHQSRFRR
ncbi:hypothetical protein Mmc1_3703 [Magnetococcus marinus MC-1]|uniref:Uncharacterized protein n=1 Tax=Magnetococcus marinus (strain ATCC BAA-1437 / JCM 17883 / MC-1) TaxID=156889 RepID=A0LDZ5_MAGMM|nr:hypothetical protein [Magnetococcus marinus]ABK46188.1 hypothetical protein Mmc1_3703 [Magnetococcus marinus MC-1]